MESAGLSKPSLIFTHERGSLLRQAAFLQGFAWTWELKIRVAYIVDTSSNTNSDVLASHLPLRELGKGYEQVVLDSVIRLADPKIRNLKKYVSAESVGTLN